jgi:hypothetical protein
MSEKPEKIEAHHVRAALRAYYPAPRCAIAFEVAQGTGLKANRHLDAIAMDLWPSHGHGIHGIEIKVNRYDWRRELKDPAKAEELARFCDYFWVAAPEGIVPYEELPPAWGLLEMTDGKIRQRKGAAKTPAQPIDRHFFAAMFRAATQSRTQGEAEAWLAREREALIERNREVIDREVKRVTQENLEDANCWRRLIAALGESKWSADDKLLIQSYQIIKNAGLLGEWNSVRNLAENLDKAAKRIHEALAPIYGPKQEAAE